MKDLKGVERPWLFRGIRVLEGLGLATVFLGLARSYWLTAGIGAVLILLSYAIYKRFFPAIAPRGEHTLGSGDGD